MMHVRPQVGQQTRMHVAKVCGVLAGVSNTDRREALRELKEPQIHGGRIGGDLAPMSGSINGCTPIIFVYARTWLYAVSPACFCNEFYGLRGMRLCGALA